MKTINIGDDVVFGQNPDDKASIMTVESIRVSSRSDGREIVVDLSGIDGNQKHLEVTFAAKLPPGMSVRHPNSIWFKVASAWDIIEKNGDRGVVIKKDADTGCITVQWCDALGRPASKPTDYTTLTGFKVVGHVDAWGCSTDTTDDNH